MTVNTFCRKISELEGKRIQVNIAQIKEVINCAKKVLKEKGVDLYAIVRNA